MKGNPLQASLVVGDDGRARHDALLERTKTTLAALAWLGGNDLVPILAALGGIAMSADDRRFIEGPLVVHGNAWMDLVPKWMGTQARAERVEIVLGKRPGIVGATEIAAVMLPATYESPMPSDLVTMYLWAATQAVAVHKGVAAAVIWEKNNTAFGDRMPDDAAFLTPAGRYWHTYEPLASEIRRKVIAHARPIEPLPKADGKPAARTPAPTASGQYSMFDR